MATRLFDPVQLLQQNLGENATKRSPLPIGEPVAQVTKLDFTSGDYKDKKTQQTKTWNRLDATCEITDPEYCAQVGDGTQEKVIAFYGIMLDMNGGEIATGENKNIALGKFRDACGCNGQPLGMCVGQYIRLNIVHKPNPKDETGQEIIHDITAVTKPD